MNDIMYDVIFPKCGNASYCKYSKNQENCCADDRIIEKCPYLKAIQEVSLLSMELAESYKKDFANNNKCYARGCDYNNIDCTCMYGNASEMICQVNCYNCERTCKRNEEDIACKRFVNKNKYKE